MFRLHDKTRRRICRAAFLLSVAPVVLATGAWCAWRNLPWQADGESRRLAECLGLKVRVGAVEFLRPGGTLYRDLELTDPETGRTLLRCRSLEADLPPPVNLSGGKPPLVLSFTQAEIETAGLSRLRRLVERFLEGECGAAAGANLRIVAPALTLSAGPRSQTFSGVECTVEHTPEGVKASTRFCLAGTQSQPPITLRLYRNRQITPPGTGFQLDTGENDLPCDVLAWVLNEFDGLGPQCRFRGRLEANQHFAAGATAGWEGKLSGQFLDLDLDALIGQRFPCRLSGVANLIVEETSFCNGRLEKAKGLLAAGPGMVGRSLLEAAAQYLELTPGANLEPLAEQVRYDQLAAAVYLDRTGLYLQGRCPADEPGTILTADRRCLLREPSTQPQPAAALAAALAPEHAYRVPLTGPTEDLARRLLPPPPQTPSTAERQPPRARLRLHE